jgi:protein gp37
MSANSNIEWTDATWNPIRGCSRVSEGCRNCYAEKVAYRFSGFGQPYEGLVRIGADGERRAEWNGRVEFVQKHLLDPLRWKPVLTGIARGEGELRKKAHKDGTVTVTRERPRRIFVNSMSDLFHENVPNEWIDKIFAVMALCPQHIFQILTKRPERMQKYLSDSGRADEMQKQITELCLGEMSDRMHAQTMARLQKGWGGLPLKHVWLGVSVENQKAADERIPLLLQTPAAVRFISAEPLLGPVDLWKQLYVGPEGGIDFSYTRRQMLHLVIVGGESGPGARPMHPDWARSLRDQCVTAEVPFFFKQWGEWTQYNPELHGPYENKRFMYFCGRTLGPYEPNPDGTDLRDWARITRVGKKAAGAMLDGREWREFPSPQQRGPVAGDPGPEVARCQP